ncbi:MAG: hypothetical protein JXA20_10660 [Spirochaetes bacterium]|nr:hypothetical protein [Spirochaetota bacterium]
MLVALVFGGKAEQLGFTFSGILIRAVQLHMSGGGAFRERKLPIVTGPGQMSDMNIEKVRELPCKTRRSEPQ